GDGVVSGVSVRDRDDAVAVAPHDQCRDLLGEIQAVTRAHALPERVNHRSHRMNERGSPPRLGEPGVAAPDLLAGDVRAEPDPAQAPARSLERLPDPRIEEDREDELAPGKADGPEEDADLLAEPTA